MIHSGVRPMRSLTSMASSPESNKIAKQHGIHRCFLHVPIEHVLTARSASCHTHAHPHSVPLIWVRCRYSFLCFVPVFLNFAAVAGICSKHLTQRAGYDAAHGREPPHGREPHMPVIRLTVALLPFTLPLSHLSRGRVSSSKLLQNSQIRYIAWLPPFSHRLVSSRRRCMQIAKGFVVHPCTTHLHLCHDACKL